MSCCQSWRKSKHMSMIILKLMSINETCAAQILNRAATHFSEPVLLMIDTLVPKESWAIEQFGDSLHKRLLIIWMPHKYDKHDSLKIKHRGRATAVVIYCNSPFASYQHRFNSPKHPTAESFLRNEPMTLFVKFFDLPANLWEKGHV